MSVEDALASAPEKPARVARPSEDALLGDVIWRLAMAQGLIAHGEVGEALMVLEDLEYDLDASLEEARP